MAAPTLLGLPPLSSDLRQIGPFLQRAEELKQREPIVAYWCAYYAAQVGLSVKAKDTASRNLLFELLNKLESLKNEIGPNDAVDREEASAAYVENFALRVFSTADDEDRRGAATRATAKKFLAAANFLEILKVFPKSDVSDTNEDKIRYAKWKAADIAKAFREGRKPVPGPAGSEPERPVSPPQTPPAVTVTSDSSSNPSNGSTTTLLTTSTALTSPPTTPPAVSQNPMRKGKRTTPPPQMGAADILRANANSPPRDGHLNVDWNRPIAGEGDASPGSWSTAATPGTAQGTPGRENWEPESPLAGQAKRREKRRTGSGSSHASTSSTGGSPPRSALKKAQEDSVDIEEKTVRFTSSVIGGSTTGSEASPASSAFPSSASSQPRGRTTSLTSRHSAPHTDQPSVGPSTAVGGVRPPPPLFAPQAQAPGAAGMTVYPTPQQQRSTIYASPPISPPDSGSPSHPPGPSHMSSRLQPSAPPLPPHHSYTASGPPPPPPPAAGPEPESEPELTPSIIAKVQKHCRFAISALDYEDGEQARKELRTALAILGGRS